MLSVEGRCWGWGVGSNERGVMRHWWWQRFSTVLLMVCIPTALFVSQDAWWGVIVALIMHSDQGVETILMDYVHTPAVRAVCTRVIQSALILSLTLWALMSGLTLPFIGA